MRQAEPPRVPQPVMYQSWRHLTFLHWKYRPETLASRLPPGLELDLFEGEAWVGLTPFFLTLRPRGLPPLPGASQCPETNLRTYVRGPDGRRGIWFFSLDAGSLVAVLGARAGYGLPYFWSRMATSVDGGAARYRSQRRGAPGGSAQLWSLVDIGVPIDADERETFLTARYWLFSRCCGRLIAAPVEHPPWPLRQARLLELDETLTRAAGLPAPLGEPLVHYSERVDVRIGRPYLA